MEHGEGAVFSAAVETEASSPPHDSSTSPVGFPENAVLEEVHSPPSDDDVNGADHAPDVTDSADDLKRKIIRQVEYYFSDENLPTDKYMLSLIKKNKGGFVPVGIIASFRKMKKLTQDHSIIVAALKESSFLVVSSDGKKVKRANPLPLTEVKDPKLCTVLVENLPEDHSVENIKRIFGKAGAIKNICIRDHVAEEPKKGSKAEMMISGKSHALVEYETEQSAEKAASTLNDERDWRNGMRVKLLSRVGKYGQRRQAWRGHDCNKNGVGPSSEQAGGDEEGRSCEDHDHTPNEEGGDHSLKDKNGHKGQNRGPPRRIKYRGSNGHIHGHGTTLSSHGTEPQKPPPGPRMPDGTRGFTMGRGRPLAADQS